MRRACNLILLIVCLGALTLLGQSGLRSPAFVAQLQRTSAGGGAYTPNTVDFAGGNTGMTNLATWPASANAVYASFWIKPDAAEAGTTDGLIMKNDDGIRIFLNSSDKVQFDCEDAGNTTLVLATSGTVTRDGNTWSHVFIRMDRTVDNQIEIYLNGSTSGMTITTFLSTGEDADPIDTDGVGTSLAALDLSQTLPYAGCMADVWLSVGNTYSGITLSDFYNAGDPVDLGATGTNPDGTTPLIFLKGSGTGFSVNSGSLGNFTAFGTALTTCSDLP